MIYLIAGKARSGKNTFASDLSSFLESRGRKVCVIELMRTLKGYCKDYFGWDGKDETKPREFLQKLGTEIIREKQGKPLFHIERLMEDISVLENFYDDFIVPDVRFPLEIEEIKKRSSMGAVSIQILREDNVQGLAGDLSKHITETALDNYHDYDFSIQNTSLEELKKQALTIVREVEKK